MVVVASMTVVVGATVVVVVVVVVGRGRRRRHGGGRGRGGRGVWSSGRGPGVSAGTVVVLSTWSGTWCLVVGRRRGGRVGRRRRRRAVVGEAPGDHRHEQGDGADGGEPADHGAAPGRSTDTAITPGANVSPPVSWTRTTGSGPAARERGIRDADDVHVHAVTGPDHGAEPADRPVLHVGEGVARRVRPERRVTGRAAVAQRAAGEQQVVAAARSAAGDDVEALGERAAAGREPAHRHVERAHGEVLEAVVPRHEPGHELRVGRGDGRVALVGDDDGPRRVAANRPDALADDVGDGVRACPGGGDVGGQVPHRLAHHGPCARAAGRLVQLRHDRRGSAGRTDGRAGRERQVRPPLGRAVDRHAQRPRRRDECRLDVEAGGDHARARRQGDLGRTGVVGADRASRRVRPRGTCRRWSRRHRRRTRGCCCRRAAGRPRRCARPRDRTGGRVASPGLAPASPSSSPRSP